MAQEIGFLQAVSIIIVLNLFIMQQKCSYVGMSNGFFLTNKWNRRSLFYQLLMSLVDVVFCSVFDYGIFHIDDCYKKYIRLPTDFVTTIETAFYHISI